MFLVIDLMNDASEFVILIDMSFIVFTIAVLVIINFTNKGKTLEEVEKEIELYESRDDT